MFSKQILSVALALSTFAVGACKAKDANRVEADNTAKNDRDQAATPTADNAVNRPSDLDLTQKIRQAVMDDSSLSTNAQNSKIVVQDGKVTLVGPVASAEERARVEKIATDVVGAKNVVNQLEITK
jgi:osmotically-inducible protein OsmY